MMGIYVYLGKDGQVYTVIRGLQTVVVVAVVVVVISRNTGSTSEESYASKSRSVGSKGGL